MNDKEHSMLLYRFFETDFPLQKEGLEELISKFKTESYKKDTILLEPGTVERKLRFLVSGVVRDFFVTKQKEVNINFYTTPQFISDFSSFNNGNETNRYQQCLSKVVIISIDKNIFHGLLEKYSCGKTFVNITFQRLLEQKEQLEHCRLTKSPEELYLCILESNPQWIIKIPQYHIASYLGITPETLSRLRKRIS